MTARVVVGMSGGVDSSVAAGLLVEQGCEVVGVTLRVSPWEAPASATDRFGSCCSAEAADDARQVARRLGIAYYLLNSEVEFAKTVIEPFVAEYRAGRTPVPCVSCNKHLKFGSLLARARAWDARWVATGHYARITYDAPSQRHLLWKARDERKDQSDFLWSLSQAQLSAARFPIGELTKAEVREHARRLGLVTAEKPESQEICFIPDHDYRSFVRARSPEPPVSGPIVDVAGKVLGRHAGITDFTIGQRKGLGLTAARALYVVDLDPTTNTVTVGDAVDLEQDQVIVDEVNFIACDPPLTPLPVDAKIRHRHVPAPATVRARVDGTAEVRFAEPQRAVTPGQSMVWYRNDCVVGGGVIARPRADPRAA